MPPLNDLAYVSYCSQAQLPLGQDELERILETSRRNNQRDGISGLLTFSGEVFVQFLEGSPTALRGLMNRLKNDTRHRDIIILWEGDAHTRKLANWDMELVTPKEAHSVMREALGETGDYAKVIALSSLLAKLNPNLHQGN